MNLGWLSGIIFLVVIVFYVSAMDEQNFYVPCNGADVMSPDNYKLLKEDVDYAKQVSLD